MKTSKLQENFDFYLQNKVNFLKEKKYYGKYITILNKQVCGAYNTEEEAILAMEKQGHCLGSFIVQLVLQNDGSSANFISNVYV